MKKYIQYQKPMATMLLALSLPTLMGIYNFGWRVLAVIALCNACCFIGEYAFLRKENKPVTMAALVSGTLLALVLPPNIPFWMAGLGSFFSIIFGKMVFGGFGKNIFNPAIVGRCFLYIAFPGSMAATWFAPAAGPAAGFAKWTVTAESEPVREIILPENVKIDGITGATTLAATKKLNQEKSKLLKSKNPETSEQLKNGIDKTISEIDYLRLFIGREAGCMGETSFALILVGLFYLLYKKSLKWQLVVGPLIGLTAMTIILYELNVLNLPLGNTLLINYLGGGTLFACVFMTTEPVSAPMNNKARWIYGIFIGMLAVIIRTMSAFNAGFMFSILLGNMFGPLIDIGCNHYDQWKKARSANA